MIISISYSVVEIEGTIIVERDFLIERSLNFFTSVSFLFLICFFNVSSGNFLLVVVIP